MDKVEAAAILKSELAKYRERSYHSLQDLLTDLDAYEVRGPSGKFYQLEVQAFWDGEPNGNLRVSAGIDDGGLISSFSPLTSTNCSANHDRPHGEKCTFWSVLVRSVSPVAPT